MSDYTFFFDESAKTNKFTVDANGELNTIKNQMADSFIGVFSGFVTEDVESSRTRFLEFEDRQRLRFNISPDKEIKSTFIKKRFFEHGLASLRPEHIEFYSDLFRTMSEMNPLLSVVCISKMEALVRSVFKDLHCEEHGVIRDNVYYTLTKFLIMYGDNEIFLAMVNVHSRKDEDKLKRIISKKMMHVIEASRNVSRMELIPKSYSCTIGEITDREVRIRTDDKFDFDSRFIIFSLTMLLDSIGISRSDIHLQIDGESDLYPEAERIYPNVIFVNSIDEPLIRFSDHLAGFLNRMIYAITVDLKYTEPRLDDFDKLNVDLETKRLLNTKWFEIKEDVFNAYRNIYRTLIRSQPYYWSTVTLSYSDELVLFYALLEYFNVYRDFKEYSGISLSEHSERFNTLSCESIKHKRFNEF